MKASDLVGATITTNNDGTFTIQLAAPAPQKVDAATLTSLNAQLQQQAALVAQQAVLTQATFTTALAVLATPISVLLNAQQSAGTPTPTPSS